MRKIIVVLFLNFIVVSFSEAQIIILWNQLNKDWTINSGGYPSEEPSLDSLYYKLSDFKLSLKKDSTYTMTFSKDSIETGSFSTNRRTREITFKPKQMDTIRSYSIVELTPDVLVLSISSLYSWVYYLSLTPHQ